MRDTEFHALDTAAAAIRTTRRALREAETLRRELSLTQKALEDAKAIPLAGLKDKLLNFTHIVADDRECPLGIRIRAQHWIKQLTDPNAEYNESIRVDGPNDSRKDEEGFIGTTDQPVKGVRLYEAEQAILADLVLIVVDGWPVKTVDGHGQEIDLPAQIDRAKFNIPTTRPAYLEHCKKMLRELRDCCRSYRDYHYVCNLEQQTALTFDEFRANLYPANMGYAVDVESLQKVREQTATPTPCSECGGSTSGCAKCNYTGQKVEPAVTTAEDYKDEMAPHLYHDDGGEGCADCKLPYSDEVHIKAEPEPFNPLQALANMVHEGVPIMVPVKAKEQSVMEIVESPRPSDEEAWSKKFEATHCQCSCTDTCPLQPNATGMFPRCHIKKLAKMGYALNAEGKPYALNVEATPMNTESFITPPPAKDHSAESLPAADD